MATLNELRQQRGQVVNQARAIHKEAQDEGRALTAEEKQQYELLMVRQGEIKDEIAREETQRTLQAELDASVSEPNQPDPGEGADRRTSEPEVMYRARFCGTPLDIVPEGRRATAEYNELFNRALLEGRGVLTHEENRALQADADTGGGFITAPQQFMAKLLQNVDDILYMRSLCTVIPLTSTASIGIPTLETDFDDFAWTSEIGEAAEDTAMEFGKRKLAPNRLAKLVKVSRDLIRYSALPIEGIVRQRLAYKFAYTEETHYLTGSGAGQPLGIFTASDDGVPTSADVNTEMEADNISADGLRNVRGALKQQYRKKAVWVLHRDGVTKLSTLKDGNGQYYWQPGLQAGDPDKLLSHAIVESENVPNTWSANQYVGMFCDLSWYWIVIGLDLEIQVLLEKYATTNQLGYIGRASIDGGPAIAEAFKRIKLAAS